MAVPLGVAFQCELHIKNFHFVSVFLYSRSPPATPHRIRSAIAPLKYAIKLRTIELKRRMPYSFAPLTIYKAEQKATLIVVYELKRRMPYGSLAVARS